MPATLWRKCFAASKKLSHARRRLINSHLVCHLVNQSVSWSISQWASSSFSLKGSHPSIHEPPTDRYFSSSPDHPLFYSPTELRRHGDPVSPQIINAQAAFNRWKNCFKFISIHHIYLDYFFCQLWLHSGEVVITGYLLYITMLLHIFSLMVDFLYLLCSAIFHQSVQQRFYKADGFKGTVQTF